MNTTSNAPDPFDDGCHHQIGETDQQGHTFLGYLEAPPIAGARLDVDEKRGNKYCQEPTASSSVGV